MEATAPVSVEPAAAVLGVSSSTIHRRIRAGALRAEQAERPQGKVWLVHLPPGTTAATADPPPPGESEAAAPTTVAPAAEAMVSLIQATIGTVLGPLVGQLDAQRRTSERQADRVAELERENGRQAAELERAAAIDRPTLQAELSPLQTELRQALEAGLQPPFAAVAGGRCANLLELWPALWTFAAVDGVEPTNNAAARALRPAVLWRKGSFGTQSDDGSRFVERLLTVAATCKQQGRSLLDFLVTAVTAARLGRPPPSLVTAPSA